MEPAADRRRARAGRQDDGGAQGLRGRALNAAAPATLGPSPSPFPLDFADDGERLLFVELGEDEFRQASFLDERLLAAGVTASSARTDDVAGLAMNLAGESDFIFHIGHAGSTLVSRLMGASERFFSLREPALLRSLARRPLRSSAAFDARLRLALRLLGRVWRTAQRSLVKATSFASEIGPVILSASPGARALAVFVSPQVYIATRLAGPASRAELPSAAGDWLDRLHARLGAPIERRDRLSEGEIAALGWTCEIGALADLAEQFPAKVRWVDFDRLLAEPERGLAAAATFLRGPGSPGEVVAMLGGGDLRRYSKGPEFAYDAAMRGMIIARARRDHAAEIARGLDWINAAGNAHPIIAAAATAPARAVRAD